MPGLPVRRRRRSSASAARPFRRALGLLPGFARDRVLRSIRRELSAAATYAGPPSVAHAEALLRAVEARSATLDGPLDAIVIGIPRTTPHLPRERPNPLLAAYLGLGLALRLWRDSFPVVEGGTVILCTGSTGISRTRRSSRTGRSSRRRASGGNRRSWPTPNARPRPTSARSRRIAPAARAIRCCRSQTGRDARPRSGGSAR